MYFQEKVNRTVFKFQKILQTKPEIFQQEWRMRVLSWRKEIIVRVKFLDYKNGKPLPPAFLIADLAMAVLEELGPEAVEMVGQYTHEMLYDEYFDIAKKEWKVK